MKKTVFFLIIFIAFHLNFHAQKIDPNFGQEGIARINLGNGYGYFQSLHELADNRLILGGTASRKGSLFYPNWGNPFIPAWGINSAWLAVFDQAGKPDSSFGQNGQLILRVGGFNDRISIIKEDKEGRILAAGRSDSSIFVTRIIQPGQPDTSYGAKGHFIIKFPYEDGLPMLRSLCLDEDGNAYLLVYFSLVRKTLLAKISVKGSLSEDFGENGIKYVTFRNFPLLGAGGLFHVQNVQLLKKNFLLLGGFYAKGQSTSNFFQKINLEGEPDSTYGDGGLLTLPYEDFGYLSDFHILNDSHILFIDNKAWDAPLAKIDLAGKLDSSFGKNGIFLPPPAYRFPTINLSPDRLRVNNEGEILVSFFKSLNETLMARIDSMGWAIDRFGYKGYVKIDIEGEFHDVQEAFIAKTNKVLVLLDYEKVAIYLQNGRLDPTLNQIGFFTSQPHDAGSILFAMKQDPSGQVWIAGKASNLPTFSALSFYGYLAHLNLHESQNAREVLSKDMLKDVRIRDIVFGDNGSKFLCGKKDNKAFLCKITSTAMLDSSFGIHGFAQFPEELNSLEFGEFEKCLLQEDGAILAVGETDEMAVVARFRPNGLPDNSFSGKGFQFLRGAPSRTKDIQILPWGSIQVVGFSGENFFVSRLLPNGAPDLDLQGTGSLNTYFGFATWGKAIGFSLAEDSSFVVIGDNGRDWVSVNYKYSGRLNQYGFSQQAIHTLPVPGYRVEAFRMATLSDSSILAVGMAWDKDAFNYKIALAKFHQGGGPDLEFGTEGSMILDLDSDNEAAFNLIELADSSILVGGSSDGQSILIHLLADLYFPEPRDTFPSQSIYIYPNPLREEAKLQYILPTDQHVRIRLITATGQEVAVLLNATRLSGVQEETLKMPEGLTPGWYVLALETQRMRRVIKIIIRP